jgi:Ankyrin repeats (many copies)
MVAVIFAACISPSAADEPAPLLTAAARGPAAQVKGLLDHGADLEARDTHGRTALLLAAQRGRLETVKLLLARGAKTDARDSQDNTAYMLALFSPAGRGDHEGVLKALPQPPRPRLALDVTWSGGRLVSSCFQNREQLAQTVEAIHPDTLLARELVRYARASGRGVIDLAGENPDMTVKIDVQPGAACEGQAGDILTFNIDVRLVRARGQETVFQKNFGGGVKGLRAQTVENPAQYAPVLEIWIKAQPDRIYWAVAEEAYRYTPQQ